MLALAQRVNWAEVEVAGSKVARIDNGLLVYVAVGVEDKPKHAEQLAHKIAHLRIFTDEQDKLNLSVQDISGGILAVPNFTLLADASKGRRPAFSAAAPGDAAKPIHDAFVAELTRLGCPVQTGVFGANMTIRSAADGPVNVIVTMPAPANSPPDAEQASSAESKDP